MERSDEIEVDYLDGCARCGESSEEYVMHDGRLYCPLCREAIR